MSQRLVDHIDTRHPRLGSRLMKLRWGGLRTVEPDRRLWASVFAASVGATALVGRRARFLPALPIVTSVIWVGVWRWDAARWRRTHVAIVVELPSERLDDLVRSLTLEGLDVDRWDGMRRVDGARHGISCRLRDLRRVNAAIDGVLD